MDDQARKALKLQSPAPLRGGGLARIRLQNLPYMLIFSLAPLFANMQGSFDGHPAPLNLMSLMGMAYCLGAALCFAWVSLPRLSQSAGVLSAVSAFFYLLWLFWPDQAAGYVFCLLFCFFFGGCASLAAFTYTYGLNDEEQLLGAVITSVFCMLAQLDYSFLFVSGLFSYAYLGVLVLVTLLCQQRYRSADYQDKPTRNSGKFSLPIALMLYFFFAHKTIEIFYTYLPGVTVPSALQANAIIGLAGVCFILVFRSKGHLSLWQMCNLYLIAMSLTFTLRFFPSPNALNLSRFFHGFEQIGFIASYALLGHSLRRHANFRLFKFILSSTLFGSMLIYMIPGLLQGLYPHQMEGLAFYTSSILFTVFLFLGPLYSRKLFHQEKAEALSPGVVESAEISAPQTDPPNNQDDPEIENSFRELMLRHALTQREQELALLLIKGPPLRDCALQLNISLDTVHFHARNIYRKLKVKNKTELIYLYFHQQEYPEP